MDRFLAATEVIDCTHPEIVSLASMLTADNEDAEAIAKRCFEWVRDNIAHCMDVPSPYVTCKASDVLMRRSGFCYGKSHLLAALLRAKGIPAALSYQRLAEDSKGTKFFLHGLVSVNLPGHGWYRIDPRGHKPGIDSAFTPPVETLPYLPTLPGERDLPERHPDALPAVTEVLMAYPSNDLVRANLPDDPSL